MKGKESLRLQGQQVKEQPVLDSPLNRHRGSNALGGPAWGAGGPEPEGARKHQDLAVPAGGAWFCSFGSPLILYFFFFFKCLLFPPTRDLSANSITHFHPRPHYQRDRSSPPAAGERERRRPSDPGGCELGPGTEISRDSEKGRG